LPSKRAIGPNGRVAELWFAKIPQAISLLILPSDGRTVIAA